MPTVHLSPHALAENLRALSRLSESTVIPVVKADAYGHGAPFAVRTLSPCGVSLFAVSGAYEARELLSLSAPKNLKNVNQKVPYPHILVMSPIEMKDLPFLARQNVILSVHSLSYARALSRTAEALKREGRLDARARLSIHLKAETGMHRLGLTSMSALREVAALPHLFPTGLYSHLANAASPARTAAQLLRFHALRRALPPSLLTHLAAGEGLLRYGSFCLSASRVGLPLYGVPLAPSPVPLLPVMRLCARVLTCHTLGRGAGLGYGDLRVPRKTRVAVLDIGYADGLPPSASRGAAVLLHGRRCPFIGSVCMDRSFIDIGTLPLWEGDSVTLFGAQTGDTARFAEECGVSPYVLLCLRSRRTERRITP